MPVLRRPQILGIAAAISLIAVAALPSGIAFANPPKTASPPPASDIRHVGPDLYDGKPVPVRASKARVSERSAQQRSEAEANAAAGDVQTWLGLEYRREMPSTSRTTPCAGSASTSRCGWPRIGVPCRRLPQRPRLDRDHRRPGRPASSHEFDSQHLPEGVAGVLGAAQPQTALRRCYPSCWTCLPTTTRSRPTRPTTLSCLSTTCGTRTSTSPSTPRARPTSRDSSLGTSTSSSTAT